MIFTTGKLEIFSTPLVKFTDFKRPCNLHPFFDLLLPPFPCTKTTTKITIMYLYFVVGLYYRALWANSIDSSGYHCFIRLCFKKAFFMLNLISYLILFLFKGIKAICFMLVNFFRLLLVHLLYF